MKKRHGPKALKPARTSQRLSRVVSLLRTARTALKDNVLAASGIDDPGSTEEGKHLRRELWVFMKKLEGLPPWLARMRNEMQRLEVIERDKKKLAALGVDPAEVLSRDERRSRCVYCNELKRDPEDFYDGLRCKLCAQKTEERSAV